MSTADVEGDELLCGWPPCPTPDCEFGVCVWAGTGLCFPCSEQLIGTDELIRRFNATHDRTWDEVTADEENEEES